MKKKAERIHIRAEEDLKAQLARAAEVAGAPVSQIIREAVTEKLAKLSRKHPEIQGIVAK